MRIKINKCKAATWGPGVQGGGGGGRPWELPVYFTQLLGPRASKAQAALLAHVAQPHTDFQEGLGCLSQQAGPLLESKTGWASAVDDGLAAGSQRRDLSSSPRPAPLSLNFLSCSTGIFLGASSPHDLLPALGRVGDLTSPLPQRHGPGEGYRPSTAEGNQVTPILTVPGRDHSSWEGGHSARPPTTGRAGLSHLTLSPRA